MEETKKTMTRDEFFVEAEKLCTDFFAKRRELAVSYATQCIAPIKVGDTISVRVGENGRVMRYRVEFFKLVDFYALSTTCVPYLEIQGIGIGEDGNPLDWMPGVLPINPWLVISVNGTPVEYDVENKKIVM